VQAIKDLIGGYAKPALANETDWYTSVCYLENAVRMPPNGAPYQGTGEIAKRLRQDYANYKFDSFTVSADEVFSSGSLAIARGKFTQTLTPKASGLAQFTNEGKWATAYQRRSNGSWKCAFDIWNSDKPATGATADGAEEQALYQLERDWAAANMKKDAAVIDKFLAKEFVSNGHGRTANKAQFLAEMKANPAKIESAENSDMIAMVFGDTVVVHGVYTEKSTTNGKDSSRKGRYTEVYAKRDGRWQCMTQYATKIQ
jgi:ketosteroid isomerase-like protein